MGQIRTPGADYRIQTRSGQVWLTERPFQGKTRGTLNEDAIIPPAEKSLPAMEESSVSALPFEAASASGNTTIDLMIVYSPGIVSAYGESGAQTRLDYLVALTNQAYADSAVHITLRLVHTAEINYTDATNNSTALTYLTENTYPFQNIDALREQYGADLVSLVRDFDVTHQGGCGIAWLNGTYGDISDDGDYGFSVVSDGSDGLYYCTDYTFAHELGHNMGSAHDRDHSSSPGAYSYSYGYDQSGASAFGTIMSYDGPEVPYFSNPDINACNGFPCGVSATEQDAANNALSLNNTSAGIASFLPSLDTDGDGIPDFQDAFPVDPTEWIDTDGDGIGNNGDLDDDNDGMPDTWENDNSLDALLSDDASTDADDDGFTNLEEYLSGTDPQDFDSKPRGPVSNDFTGDAKTDILLRNNSTGQLWMYEMNGATITQSTNVGALNPAWQTAGIADFNGDAKNDILFRNTTTGQLWLYTMNGNVVIASQSIGGLNLAWVVGAASDLTGDGKADILLRNTASGQLWLYTMNGTTISTSRNIGGLNPIWKIADVRDFTGDSRSDILLRNTSTGQIWLYTMNGATITASQNVGGLILAWEIAATADLTGDNKADILLRNTTTGQMWLYIMNGATIAASRNVGALNPAWSVEQVSDFSGDGKSDILLRHADLGLLWLYTMNGNTITASEKVVGLSLDWTVQ
ncbi:MAG: FG-GAP-like repeat-containing protein [Pseudomonadota bacterium]